MVSLSQCSSTPCSVHLLHVTPFTSYDIAKTLDRSQPCIIHSVMVIQDTQYLISTLERRRAHTQPQASPKWPRRQMPWLTSFLSISLATQLAVSIIVSQPLVVILWRTLNLISCKSFCLIQNLISYHPWYIYISRQM